MKSYLFIDKAKRDAKAKELQSQGLTVSRTHHSNQLLHPRYVEDYPRQLSPEEKGFGNTLYKTFFARLYEVECAETGS